jgi:hypothetical protein
MPTHKKHALSQALEFCSKEKDYANTGFLCLSDSEFGIRCIIF